MKPEEFKPDHGDFSQEGYGGLKPVSARPNLGWQTCLGGDHGI